MSGPGLRGEALGEEAARLLARCLRWGDRIPAASRQEECPLPTRRGFRGRLWEGKFPGAWAKLGCGREEAEGRAGTGLWRPGSEKVPRMAAGLTELTELICGCLRCVCCRLALGMRAKFPSLGTHLCRPALVHSVPASRPLYRDVEPLPLPFPARIQRVP